MFRLWIWRMFARYSRVACACGAHVCEVGRRGGQERRRPVARAGLEWEEKLEEHRPDPTPEIAAKAKELTSGAPDFYTKLSRITDYIQKNIRYFVVERGIGGWQAHYASGDLSQRLRRLQGQDDAAEFDAADDWRASVLLPRRQRARHDRSRGAVADGQPYDHRDRAAGGASRMRD